VRLRVDGGIKTGRDVMVAALLGADEVSFGTALLIAEGCLMVRSCHLDTCPVGIATQRPELRAKFAATPEAIEAYLLHVAEEVRGHLATIGVRSFAEAVGHADLLRPRETTSRRTASLDLRALLHTPHGGFAGDVQLQVSGGELGERLAGEAAAVLEQERIVELEYAIENRDRAVGARLGVEIAQRFGAAAPPGRVRARFAGSAGQSFGAFLAAGVELDLVGEANDYVGKGMSGGRIVVAPPPGDAGDPVLLGNAVLYGATGGELFCSGRAGERFAVRNSGAVGVVEGVGDHLCEYMTGGSVVVLGEFGLNVGAGMSGGQVFAYDPHALLPLRLSDRLVVAEQLDAVALEALRKLVERHAQLTHSAAAQALLDRWHDAGRHFRHVVPRVETAGLAYEHTADTAVAAAAKSA
jgi:glutamate synthase domain-containing protein 3